MTDARRQRATDVNEGARDICFTCSGGRRAYEWYKGYLGKALLLGLEFLVAADIVRTVALEPTLVNVVTAFGEGSSGGP